MDTRKIGSLDVSVVGIGCNNFGMRIDEAATRAVVDAALDAGITLFDTADIYGGTKSEEYLGRALGTRRDRAIVATKFGAPLDDERKGASAAYVKRAVDDSLRRLGTDRIDLYYAHVDDSSTPLEETLSAFDSLVREGKVRHIAASNFTASRLEEALKIASREGFARYAALQPHYNLVDREKYEVSLAEVVAAHGLACVPYFGLARGFLTGKYRQDSAVDSPRAAKASAHLDARGLAILAALDEIAAAHETSVASVALAWLAAQPSVAAPIASARNTAQLAELLPMAQLQLSPTELAALATASA
ncbi:MAG: aldo/keto reductase [Geminicoccales bacterium]